MRKSKDDVIFKSTDLLDRYGTTEDNHVIDVQGSSLIPDNQEIKVT